MTTTQVVETSVTVNNNSPIQDYFHLDNQTQAIADVIVIRINQTARIYVITFVLTHIEK